MMAKDQFVEKVL
jgi:dynein heavy chain 1